MARSLRCVYCKRTPGEGMAASCSRNDGHVYQAHDDRQEEEELTMKRPTYNHTRGDSPSTPCPECAPPAKPSEADHDLAEYLVRFLRRRNGAELEPAFGAMRVEDFENLHDELAWILAHGGHPPNWLPEDEESGIAEDAGGQS